MPGLGIKPLKWNVVTSIYSPTSKEKIFERYLVMINPAEPSSTAPGLDAKATGLAKENLMDCKNSISGIHGSGGNGSEPSKIFQLLELGIEGGIGGKSVSFTFRDFTKDVKIDLWNQIAKKYSSNTVADIFTRSDVKKYRDSLSDLRVVIFHKQESWGEELKCRIARKRMGDDPIPAVLSSYADESIDDPGATLLVTNRGNCEVELGDWLLSARPACPRDTSKESTGNKLIDVSTNRLMRSLREVCKERCDLSPNNFKVIDGLITGAAIRSLKASPSPKIPQIEALPEHYDLVRSLLNCRLLDDDCEPFDRLTLAMLKRANLYMESKVSKKSSYSIFARQGDSSTTENNNQPSQPASVSRGVLKELGDRHSGVLQALVDSVLKKPDKTKLKSLCLPDAIVDRICAHPSDDNRELVLENIDEWTYKKIRTRFDKLEKDGFIVPLRPETNREIRYPIPSGNVSQRSPFVNLPEVGELIPVFGAMD